MKKYLPVILFLVGLAVVGGAFVFIKGRGNQSQDVEVEEEVAREVPLGQRPVASLTPSEDGHWLTLKVEKIVIDAESMDYELLYKLPDGRTQGVPGTIKLKGQKEIERELLLGSESSGKFRYDEGVENGTLTLRFRSKKGKLIAKFSTDFNLQTDVDKLFSVDGKFVYEMKKISGEYFVTMETFGVPDEVSGDILEGPYGIFSSSAKALSGEVDFGKGVIQVWTDNAWEKLDGLSSSDIGIFVQTSD